MTLASQADLFSDSPRPRTQTTRSGEELRDQALDRMERKKANTAYILRQRERAHIIAERKGNVTVDDLRKIEAPPTGSDPRLMGAILRPPEWRKIESTKSERKTCHCREIARFIRAEKAREA